MHVVGKVVNLKLSNLTIFPTTRKPSKSNQTCTYVTYYVNRRLQIRFVIEIVIRFNRTSLICEYMQYL